MSNSASLLYLFICASVGLVCGGALAVAVRRQPDVPRRSLLFLHAVFSGLVVAMLLRAYVLEHMTPGPTAILGWEVAVALVGRYALLLALLLFAHRLVGHQGSARNRLAIGAVAGAFLVQIVTEYLLTKRWDQWGDVAEDVFAAIVLIYVVAVSLPALRSNDGRSRIQIGFVAILLVFVPALILQLLLADDPAWPLHALLYCCWSLALTFDWLRSDVSGRKLSRSAQQSRWNRKTAPMSWGLSARESEVVEQLAKGSSNREIAAALNISLHTVKSHMRAILEKSGARDRLALVVSLFGAAVDCDGRAEHPKRH